MIYKLEKVSSKGSLEDLELLHELIGQLEETLLEGSELESSLLVELSRLIELEELIKEVLDS